MATEVDQVQVDQYVKTALADGFCVIPGLFDSATLDRWHEAFQPLLAQHIEREGDKQNRGSNRYYVTLPFTEPFADPTVFENDLVLAVVSGLVGADGVMCQLATDTPLVGSDYQEVHRDTQLLFPETGQETMPYQLAVNFPLVDVTPENGPIEIAPGTHMISKAEGLRRLESGEIKLEPIYMKKGDVMVRDVRGIHRGTPNYTEVPRPMVVIGYSRRWLFRPEVSVRIPRASLPKLSERARSWLRYQPVVESLSDPAEEAYQVFAY